jgi:protein-tyrosine phosphatase
VNRIFINILKKYSENRMQSFMDKKKVLFVCLGNICRSPAAEAVMIKLLKDNKLGDLIEVDSAGTIDYHEGEPADARMRVYAEKRGYNLNSFARKFNPDTDFEKFDYIITMDDNNFEEIKVLDLDNKFTNKIYRMADFSKNYDVTEIPDPYYGGREGFENVLDILEDAASGLIKKLENDFR